MLSYSDLIIFVCGLERERPAHLKQIDSSIDKLLSSSPLQFMDSLGNNAAKAKYEQIVPAFYYRPTYTDCM